MIELEMPQKQKTRRKRTYARNRATTVTALRDSVVESDSIYFLKLVIVVILGTLWIKLQQPVSWQGIPFGGFPLGGLIALVGIHSLEKNQFDRKIWYAVLIIVTIICYFVPAGIVL
jgi:hypothetical protein